MQFNSIEFLYGFLPLFMAAYIFARGRLRQLVMTVGSLALYWLATGGNVLAMAVLLTATVFSYEMGFLLEQYPSKLLLTGTLLCLGGTLTFFKVFSGGIYLAAGMSFYLFQMAAYLIDIYRGKMTPVRRFLRYCSQTLLFAKLLSGPLMDPETLKMQNMRARSTPRNVHDGLQTLIVGLGFKVLLANKLGGLWAQAGVVGYANISVPFAWLAILAYVMRLYFDFYGYSLMAIGLGRMMGYQLPQNFLDPYAACSVSDFYRRWHATLGAWFKEYLYIPLGGNRKGTARTILNLGIVWLFTGLWHGVGGNYLIWAGFLFLMIVWERLWLGERLKKTKVLCHVYVVFVIVLSWIPFAIGDFHQMMMFIGRLFGLTGRAANLQDFVVWGRDYAGLMAAGVFFATPIPGKIWKKIRGNLLTDVALVALFWMVVYGISTAAQDPFMYFQY